jgi:putative membrane protein
MKNTKHPRWITKFLTTQEIESVSEAVKNAEKTTSGEIVPVIVKKSSSTGHLPYLITCLFIILFLAVEGFNFLGSQFKIHFSGEWSVVGLYLSLFILIAIVFGISYRLANVSCVQRFLLLDKEKTEQVHKRALLEFYLNHVTQTKLKTGILIFISLMERQTVVIGDEAISKKIPESTWQEIVSVIINSIKNNQTADGLKSAIEKCGNILSLHFPNQQKNPNELQNNLIIKD